MAETENSVALTARGKAFLLLAGGKMKLGFCLGFRSFGSRLKGKGR